MRKRLVDQIEKVKKFRGGDGKKDKNVREAQKIKLVVNNECVEKKQRNEASLEAADPTCF